jgi:putative endonuclease
VSLRIPNKHYFYFMQPVAWVYLITNKHHTTLYTGMSTNLPTRVWEHQTKSNPGSFTARYNVNKPVYYEGHDTVEAALERERYIKGKTRKWKEELIRSKNPEWKDLTDEIINGMEP